MDDRINLAEKLALLDKPYVPGIVGYINDYKLQVVKVKGPFVWHKHDETDDFSLVIRGRLTIHLRDRDVVLDPGEIFVVPRAALSTAQMPRRKPRCCSSNLTGRSTPGTRAGP